MDPFDPSRLGDSAKICVHDTTTGALVLFDENPDLRQTSFTVTQR